MADHKGVRSDKCSISLAKKKKALSAIQRGKSAINRLQTMGAARRANNKKKGFESILSPVCLLPILLTIGVVKI